MNRISLSAIVSLSLVYSCGALAQDSCTRPEAVAIPDGASATLDDMLAAQSGVREFNSAMEEYLDCMNEMIDGADEETPPETVNEWINEYNEGVGEMETLAAQFNEERIAYQQANPSE